MGDCLVSGLERGLSSMVRVGGNKDRKRLRDYVNPQYKSFNGEGWLNWGGFPEIFRASYDGRHDGGLDGGERFIRVFRGGGLVS